MNAHSSSRNDSEEQVANFVAMLPKIESQLRRQFKRLNPDAAEEAVQEGIAASFKAFVRLSDRGLTAKAFPSILADFAARHVRAGRQVGSSLNVADPLSPYAQSKKGIRALPLELRGGGSDWLEDALVDRRTSIPDRVAIRIDMPRWLQGLSQRMQRIAEDLAFGSSASEVAVKHRVSVARISQIRRELYESWQQFHWTSVT